LVQSVRSGTLRIVDAPDPVIGPTEVLVQTHHSVVSAGTERAVRQLASASLLQKAKARPDLVRQIIRKARTEGLKSTFDAVQTRLDDEMPLGYSAAGLVLEVGEAVSRVRPGMRVATAGASHGDLQVVAGNVAVPIPETVESSSAAFATVAAIALHGLRQAEVGPGGKVCVIGLGLIGQLTVRLALASGLDVVGIDVRDWAAERASDCGATGLVEAGTDTTSRVMEWSRGRGVDAVMLTAATPSSEPILRAADLARDRAVIVVVGDVGMELQRRPLYEKELSIRVARSYGPGRYERAYEEWAVDYPAGQVRWTEGRNIEAALDLMASERLTVDGLVTHSFAFDRAADAYVVLEDPSAHYLGIRLDYPVERRSASRPKVAITSARGQHVIGLIGAGTFARGVLVPALREAGIGTIRAVSSAGGVSAARLAERIGAEAMTTDELLADDTIDLIVVATSHDSHASLVVRALDRGKHVFCEKPLALTEDELHAVETAWERSGMQLAVGFNRRHSPWIKKAINALQGGSGPLVITYRANAGTLPQSHWYHDRRQGGRVIGEVCHFIDTCNALAGGAPDAVSAFGGGKSETMLVDDVAIALRYPCGSVATISYATGGHASTEKERLEVLGRGHTIVINDFQSLSLDGKVEKGPRDKGHRWQFKQFVAPLQPQDDSGTESAFETTRASLIAVESLGTGSPVSTRLSHALARSVAQVRR
jgi:predicted dehydrogenase